MRFLIMLLAAVGAAGLAACWPSQPGWAAEEAFDAGEYWGGYASYDPEGGEFSFCAIHADYRNGISVHIAMSSSFELMLLLGNSGWRLTPGSEFPLTLSVDERWSRDVVASATDETGVIVSLGDDWEAYDALRRGRDLIVEARRQTFAFGLKGSAAALTEAARCVMDRTQAAGGDPFSIDGGGNDSGAGGQGDPFGAGGGGMESGFGAKGGGRRTTALGAKGDAVPPRNSLASLLAVAGLDDVHLLSEAELQQDFPYADEAWSTGNVYGMLFAYVNEGQSAVDVARYQVDWMRENCRGRFDGEVTSRRSGSTFEPYVARCDAVKMDDSYVVYGIALVTAEGLLAFEHVGYPEDDTAVAAVAAKVAAVLARYELP